MKKSRWIAVLSLLVTGLLIVPIAAYILGGRIVGTYAGPRGLASYLGAIYSDAVHGSPAALLILIGPVIGIAIWPLRSWLLRSGAQPGSGAA